MAKAPKTNKPKQAKRSTKAKTKPKSITTRVKPRAKSPAKRAIQGDAKKISRLSRKRWDTMSKDHQEQYLKDHPKSMYVKIGVKHDEGHSSHTEQEKPAHDTETGSTSGGTSGPTNTSETTETPHDTTTDSNANPDNTESKPKVPFRQRFRKALSGLKDTLKQSGAASSPAELNKSLEQAVEKPLTHEESEQRQEEYKRNPPDKPKDSHDVMAMVVGIAAIAAIGALATVAPGAAILVGLQVLDHAPDMLRAFGERQEKRGERSERDWDEYSRKHQEFLDEDENYKKSAKGDHIIDQDEDEDTADIIGDTVAKHVAALDEKDQAAIQETLSGASEADAKDANAETNPATPPVEENKDEDTDAGEDEGEEDESTDDDEDEDEDEPEPEPVSKRRRKVQAAVLASFEGIDPRTDLEKTIARVAEKHDKTRKLQQATLSDQGNGTYAALKLHPSSARMLANWAKNQGVKKPFDPSYMHITTCYSKKPVDYKPLSFIHGGREVHPKALEFLGRDEGASNNEKTLVLLLDPGFANRRFNYARAQGASHDFPEYKPHISIAPPGHGLEDISDFDVGSINFPLLVDYEYSDVLSATIPSRGIAVSRPNPVIAKRFTRAGQLQNNAGRTLHYRQGDIKLIDSHGDIWPIKASIFKQRYRRLDDGRFDKRSRNQVYYSIHSGNLETIDTLEGPQTVRPGDYILQSDAQGECWPVSAEDFKRLYLVVVDKN